MRQKDTEDDADGERCYTTHRTSLRNNTSQSNSLYPTPTLNKEMSPTTLKLKQN